VLGRKFDTPPLFPSRGARAAHLKVIIRIFVRLFFQSLKALGDLDLWK